MKDSINITLLLWTLSRDKILEKDFPIGKSYTNVSNYYSNLSLFFAAVHIFPHVIWIIFVSFFLRNLFNFLIIFTKQFLHDRSSASIPCVFRDLYLKWIISSILYSRTYLSIYLWNIYIYIYEIYVFQNSWSTSGFPNHSTIDIWGWTIHCWRAGPWIPKDSAFLRRYGIIRK